MLIFFSDMKYFNFSWSFYDARFSILSLGLFNAAQQLKFSRSNLDRKVPNIFGDSLSTSYFLTLMPDSILLLNFFDIFALRFQYWQCHLYSSEQIGNSQQCKLIISHNQFQLSPQNNLAPNNEPKAPKPDISYIPFPLSVKPQWFLKRHLSYL